jgi:hypothetical protein
MASKQNRKLVVLVPSTRGDEEEAEEEVARGPYAPA